MENLLLAAERCLATKTYRELTLQELAEAAEMTAPMIRYYFQNKDGLFIALLNIIGLKLLNKINEIESNIKQGVARNYSHDLVVALMSMVQSNPGIIRTLNSERLRNSSAIKAYYISGRYSIDRILSGIKKLIIMLIEKNYYVNDTDVDRAVLTMISMTSAPLYLEHALNFFHQTPEDFASEFWIDHIAEIFDLKYRARQTHQN